MLAPEGSFVAIPTPFTAGGAIDFGAFDRLVDLHAANGSTALLVMGSCGEPTLLTLDERREIIDRVTPMATGRIAVFFGTTMATTKDTVELSQRAEQRGATGIVLVVPPYVTPPQEAVFEHFLTVAQHVTCSVAIYNNPARVGVHLKPETLARLHAASPNISIDKEAMADSSQIAEVLYSTNHAMQVFCCDYPAYGLIPSVLALGGSGVAGVTANVAVSEMAALARPWSGAVNLSDWRELYGRLLPLMKAMYWLTNPIVVKAALNLMGISVGSVRRPLADLQGERLAELDQLIVGLDLKRKYAAWVNHTQVTFR